MPVSWSGRPASARRHHRHHRRGMGAVMAFIVWVIAIALVYALSQSEAQSGALKGVVRAAGLRAIQWSGRSALNEASYKIRWPSSKLPGPALELSAGKNPGSVDPSATKQLYAPQISRGELSLGQVECRLVSVPKEKVSTEPWLLDLAVRVEYRLAGVNLVRHVRRRHVGHQFHALVESGPRKGERIPTTVSIDAEPIFEVLEP